MRKEVLIAILSGSLLGLVIAFGIWRANSALSPKRNQTQKQETPSPTSSPTPKAEGLQLTILRPENNSILSDKNVEISGKTEANATVVIQYDKGETILVSDDNGSFSYTAELIPGANTITMTAFNNNGESVEKTINVVYSTEFPKS